MMHYICFFITNLLDFIILRKYLKTFTDGALTSKNMQGFIMILCVILLTFINLGGNPNLNLLVTCISIVIYSLTYKLQLPYRLLLIAFYIGIGIVAEPVGLLFVRALNGIFSIFVSYYLSNFLCEIIRFFIVRLICQIWKAKWNGMSFKMGILFFSIPVTGIIITCITVNLAGFYNTVLTNSLCLCIIILVFIGNILTFAIYDKLTSLIMNNYQKELLIQEAKSKEMYYKQIEESNKKIQTIKHDLKNRMITIIASKDQNIIFDEIEKIIGEIDESDSDIYTKNKVINTILHSKISIARKHDIKIESSILIPQKLNILYSDAGILIGNLLDNAIEACEFVLPSKRWILIEMQYIKGKLILKICNSKNKKEVNINVSHKNHSDEHGLGIKSVKNVIKNYDGVIEFFNHGETFETNVVLYGIKMEDKNESQNC